MAASVLRQSGDPVTGQATRPHRSDRLQRHLQAHSCSRLRSGNGDPRERPREASGL